METEQRMTEQVIEVAIEPMTTNPPKLTVTREALATGMPVRWTTRSGRTGWVVEFVGDNVGVATEGTYELWPYSQCTPNRTADQEDLPWVIKVLAKRFAPEQPVLSEEQQAAVLTERKRLDVQWTQFWEVANAKATRDSLCGEYDTFTARFDAPARPIRCDYRVSGTAVRVLNHTELQRCIRNTHGPVQVAVGESVTFTQSFDLAGSYLTPRGQCGCREYVTQSIVEDMLGRGTTAELNIVTTRCSFCNGHRS